MIKKYIQENISESLQVKKLLHDNPSYQETISEMGELLINTFKNGNKVLLFGNGGSASDAQHMAAEFVGRFRLERHPLPAIAFPCNTSSITAIGNDYGYSEVFSRQVQALGQSGDLAIGFSTSGKSPNVIKAFEVCKSMKITSLGFTGSQTSPMDTLCDKVFKAPSQHTARIQETHIFVIHLLCECVDQAFFETK